MNQDLMIAFCGAMSIVCSCVSIAIIGISNSLLKKNYTPLKDVLMISAIIIVLITFIGMIVIVSKIQIDGKYVLFLLVLSLIPIIVSVKRTIRLKNTDYRSVYIGNVIFVCFNIIMLVVAGIVINI